MTEIVAVSRSEWAELSKNPKIIKWFEIVQKQSQEVSIADGTINSIYADLQALKAKIQTIESQVSILNSLDISRRLTLLEAKA